MTVLQRYIRHVYYSKYHPLWNNCLCKSYRILITARRLGHTANLSICISHPRHSACFGLPGYFIHFYTLVDGEKVDVAYDPELEKLRMKNTDVRVTKGIILPRI